MSNSPVIRKVKKIKEHTMQQQKLTKIMVGKAILASNFDQPISTFKH